MGEAVSVLVEGLPPCGTGHFGSVDMFTPSFLWLENLSHDWAARVVTIDLVFAHLQLLQFDS
jgi:hypothetical protein